MAGKKYVNLHENISAMPVGVENRSGVTVGTVQVSFGLLVQSWENLDKARLVYSLDSNNGITIWFISLDTGELDDLVLGCTIPLSPGFIFLFFGEKKFELTAGACDSFLDIVTIDVCHGGAGAGVWFFLRDQALTISSVQQYRMKPAGSRRS
ncbi:hypothetical protein Tco_1245659 [Tanacetum coccineum]